MPSAPTGAEAGMEIIETKGLASQSVAPLWRFCRALEGLGSAENASNRGHFRRGQHREIQFLYRRIRRAGQGRYDSYLLQTAAMPFPQRTHHEAIRVVPRANLQSAIFS